MINLSWSKYSHFIVLLISWISIAKSDVPRPRGVSAAKATLYSPTKDFTCFDGTDTIPFSYVNDDYCDCLDGSDEPGTSACFNGVFHCANMGHRPQNIPSSWVNDGLCDCCDGSDEYTISNKCPNSCDELGREAKAEALRLAELHKAGSQLKLELTEKGNKKRSEMAEQLIQLEKDKAEADKVKVEREIYKNDLEAKENEALKVYRQLEEQQRQKDLEEAHEIIVKEALYNFEKFDSNRDDQLTLDEIKVINAFDKNKDGQVDAEELEYFIGDNEVVNKDLFTSKTWPLLKPLLMMEKDTFTAQKEDEESDQDIDAHDSATDLDTENDEVDEDGADEDNLDEDLPQEEIDEHTLEPEASSKYDIETQKLINEAKEARQQLADAERTMREIEANIKNIQQQLERDYGLQQEFATLDGQCLEYEDREYIYKLCLFQKVTQKAKNGGMEVGLGNWGEWAGQGNQYSIMKYTNGIACWNGPNRMTIVNIKCGLETKLLSVTEPFRCEYKMELSTPAACDESIVSQEHGSHDEL